MLKYGILDWPQWSTPGCTVAQYREYVKVVLQKSCRQEISSQIKRHSQRLPYYVLGPGQGNIPCILKALQLPVDISYQVRHWCRLRCGLILLRHLGGRECAVKHQSCIFCQAPSDHPLVHCVALCPRWSTQRREFMAAAAGESGETNQQFTVRVLSSCLSRHVQSVVVKWAKAIDDEAYHFWSR